MKSETRRQIGDGLGANTRVNIKTERVLTKTTYSLLYINKYITFSDIFSWINFVVKV